MLSLLVLFSDSSRRCLVWAFMITLKMHRESPDSPVRMPDSWLESLLIEGADSYKESTLDPLFFLITL